MTKARNLILGNYRHVKQICTTVGVRILCSKIRELCYVLMLTISANYAPQISHYAPEICHYASKQNNFFVTKTHFHIEVIKHIEVTKLKIRSKVSLISHACCTAASKMGQKQSCQTGYQYYNRARCSRPFFPIESHGNCACAICTGLKNNRIMPALCSML